MKATLAFLKLAETLYSSQAALAFLRILQQLYPAKYSTEQIASLDANYEDALVRMADAEARATADAPAE